MSTQGGMPGAETASRAAAIAHVNRLVGERVMGWAVRQVEGSDLTPQFVIPTGDPSHPTVTRPVWTWRPLGEIEQAMMVMQRMWDVGPPLDITTAVSGWMGFLLVAANDCRWAAGWRGLVANYPDAWFCEARADNPSEAICLAALIRCGVYDMDEHLGGT